MLKLINALSILLCMRGKGRHIAFEGIDGSGKTSVASELFLRIRAVGRPCYYTYEPTDSRIGSYIRLHLMKERDHHPSYEALLYAADRVQHFYGEILDYRKKGYVVLSDRYVYSSIAYQGAMLRDPQWVSQINKMVPKPDLTIYFRVSPDLALSRKKLRRRTIYEHEDFLRNVIKIYEKLVKAKLLIAVDASRPFNTVLKECCDTVGDFIGERL